jgi:hypothetical protein
MAEQDTTIKTFSYVLDEEPVMRMVRRRALRQQLFFAIGVVVTAVVIAGLHGGTRALLCGFTFAVFYGGYVILVGYGGNIHRQRRAFSDARWFSVPHWNETDGEFFGTYERGGAFSKNKLAGLFRQVEFRDEHYFLQYASDRGILMIPAHAFESEADRERFERLLADKGVPVARRG